MDLHAIWMPGRIAPVVLLLVMCGVAPAAAQTVQKCVGAGGHVTLTSGACGPGQQLVARYDAVPEPLPVAAAAPAGQRVADGAGRPAARATAAGRGPGRASARSRPRADRCEAARDRRERTLERVGLKRNFDLLRRLDDEVRAACR